MRQPRPKQLTMTTGEVAKMCNVSPVTVSKWCDSGIIRYHRLPNGLHHRRIYRSDLLIFAETYGMHRVVEKLREERL